MSLALASGDGIARSFTQSQYGIVTSGLTAISAASIFARYSRCQVRKLRLPCAPHIIPAAVSIARRWISTKSAQVGDGTAGAASDSIAWMNRAHSVADRVFWFLRTR